jgi:hypothetical protein
MGIFSLKKSKTRRHTRRNVSKFNRRSVITNGRKNKSIRSNKKDDLNGLTNLFGKMNLVPHYEPVQSALPANNVPYFYDSKKSQIFYLDPNDTNTDLDSRRKFFVKKSDDIYNHANLNYTSLFKRPGIYSVLLPQDFAENETQGELLYKRPWNRKQEGYEIIDVESPPNSLGRIRTNSGRRRRTFSGRFSS